MLLNYSMSLPSMNECVKKRTLVTVQFVENNFSSIELVHIKPEKSEAFLQIIKYIFDCHRLTQIFSKSGPFLDGEIKVVPATEYLQKCILKKLLDAQITNSSTKMLNAYFSFNNFDTNCIKKYHEYEQHYMFTFQITNFNVPQNLKSVKDNSTSDSDTLIIKVEPDTL